MSTLPVTQSAVSARLNLVLKERDLLCVPASIYVYMQQPTSLWTSKPSDGLLVERESELRVLRRWAVRLLRFVRGWRRMRLDHLDISGAYFVDRHGRIPSGSYGMGNYFPLFQLFGVTGDGGESADNERASVNASTWASIEEYHEHLSLNDQDAAAHDISKLICSAVASLVPQPKRILELGCGAGRNLYWMSKQFPDADIVGVDINGSAEFRAFLPANVKFIQADVLKLDFESLGQFDVIFTCGFLMHLNHRDVSGVVRSIEKNSRASIIFELHGPSNAWDFHRYPRSYANLFDTLGIEFSDYRIFPGDPIYSYELTKSFAHAMLSR